MKRKFVSVFLCVSLAMGMLAGCGGGSEEEVQKKDGEKPYAGEKLTVLYMSGVYADAANSMVDELSLIHIWIEYQTDSGNHSPSPSVSSD